MKWYDWAVVAGMSGAAGLCDHFFGAPSALGFIFGSLFVLMWQSFERMKKEIVEYISCKLFILREDIQMDLARNTVRTVSIEEQVTALNHQMFRKSEGKSDEIRDEI